MADEPVHMPSIDGTDYTLCGVAYEAYETGDADEPIIIGEPGQLITCWRCTHIIRECKAIRGFKVPKPARNGGGA